MWGAREIHAPADRTEIRAISPTEVIVIFCVFRIILIYQRLFLDLFNTLHFY